MGLRGNKKAITRATIVLKSFFKSKGYYVLLGPLRASKRSVKNHAEQTGVVIGWFLLVVFYVCSCHKTNQD